MKDLIIKNVADVQSKIQENPDTTFGIKSVTAGNDVDTCGV